MQPLQTLRCRLGCVPREDGLLRIEGLQLELFGLVKVSTPFRVYGRRLTPKELAKSELDGQKYPPGRRRSLSSIEFVSSDITPHATRDLSRSEIHARKRHRYFAESLKLHKLLAKDEEHQERARNHRADYRLNVHVSSRLPRVSYKFRNWPSGQKSALLDGEILTNVSLVVMNTGNVPIIDFRVGVSPSDFVFFPEIARRLELSCLAPASGKQNRPQLGVAVRNYKPLMPGAAITIPLVVRASDVGTFRIGFCLYAAAGSGPEAVEAIAAQPAAVPSPDNHDATSTIYTPQKMRAKTSGGAALSISHLERKWQAVERSLTVGPSLSLKTTSTISSHKLDFYSVITHLENRCRSAAINLVDLTVFPAEDEEQQQAKVVGKDRGAAAPPEKSVWQLRTADCLPLTPVPAEHLTLASNKSLELLFSCRSPISQAAALSGKTAAHGDAPFHSRKHPLSAPPLSPGHHKGPSPIKSQALSTAAMIRELHNFFGPLTQLVDNFKLGTDLLRSLPHPTPRMTPPPTAPADDQDPSASLEAAADALAADETALIGVIYEFYCEMHHTVRKQRLRKSPVDGTNVDDSGMISADAVDIVARWQYTPPQPQTTAPLSPAGNPPSPPPAQAAIKGTSPQSGPLRGAIVRRGEILNCRVYLFKGPSYCPLKVQVSPPSRSIPLNWPRSCTVPIKVHVRNMTRTQRLSALVGVDQEASAFKMTPSGGEGGGREVSESPYSASLYSQATSSKQPIMQAFGGDAAVAASRKLFAASGFFWIGATLRRLPPLEPMQAAEVFLTAWFPAPGVYNVQKLKISVETSEFVLENPRADGDIQQDCDFHRILGMEPPAEEAADETRRYTNIVMNSYVYVFPSQREAIWAQPASLRRRSASRSGAGSSRGAGSAQRRRSKPPSPDAADDMPEQSSVCQQQQEETTATVGGVAKTPTPRGGKVALRSSGSASGKQMGIAPSAATVRKSYSPSGGVT